MNMLELSGKKIRILNGITSDGELFDPSLTKLKKMSWCQKWHKRA